MGNSGIICVTIFFYLKINKYTIIIIHLNYLSSVSYTCGEDRELQINTCT